MKLLDIIEQIIRQRKQELQKLDELIKARFVEMLYDKGYPVLKWNDVFNTTTESWILMRLLMVERIRFLLVQKKC